MKALAIAATGMNAQQTNLEVIANNIANINTTGFKRARAEFSDLLYQVDRMQGVPSRANSSLVPEGVSIGLGVKTSAVRNVHVQGGLTSTGNNLDLAITGKSACLESEVHGRGDEQGHDDPDADVDLRSAAVLVRILEFHSECAPIG